MSKFTSFETKLSLWKFPAFKCLFPMHLRSKIWLLLIFSYHFFGFYEYIFRVLSKVRIYVVYFLFCKICFGYSYFEWFVFWLSTTDEVMAAKLLCSDIFVQSTCNISIQDVQLTVTVPAHFPVKHVRSMNIFHKLNIGNYIRVAPVR